MFTAKSNGIFTRAIADYHLKDHVDTNQSYLANILY